MEVETGHHPSRTPITRSDVLNAVRPSSERCAAIPEPRGHTPGVTLVRTRGKRGVCGNCDDRTHCAQSSLSCWYWRCAGVPYELAGVVLPPPAIPAKGQQCADNASHRETTTPP